MRVVDFKAVGVGVKGTSSGLGPLCWWGSLIDGWGTRVGLMSHSDRGGELWSVMKSHPMPTQQSGSRVGGRPGCN